MIILCKSHNVSCEAEGRSKKYVELHGENYEEIHIEYLSQENQD
jgi:hypothetical protein